MPLGFCQAARGILRGGTVRPDTEGRERSTWQSRRNPAGTCLARTGATVVTMNFNNDVPGHCECLFEDSSSRNPSWTKTV